MTRDERIELTKKITAALLKTDLVYLNPLGYVNTEVMSIIYKTLEDHDSYSTIFPEIKESGVEL